MLTKEAIIKKLENHKTEIKTFGVKKLSLFGSYAKNTAKKGSDIDFLVEFKRGRGLLDDYANLLEFLERIFNKKVDLVKSHLVREELKEEILGGTQIEAKI